MPKTRAFSTPVTEFDEGWKYYFGKYMLVHAVLSHTWLVVQIIKTSQTKNADDLSIPAFTILVFSAFVWFIYGNFVLRTPNRAIIISATVSGTLAIALLLLIIVYQNGDHKADN